MATHASTTSRRALFAAAALAPAAATAGTLAENVKRNPDAYLIALADRFVCFHVAKEARTEYLNEKPTCDWTEADHALWDSSLAENTNYHEDLAVIAAANLLRLQGVALPEWAA